MASSPRNPDSRRYSNYYGVSAFPWRSARTFGHAKLPVCSRNVVTRADVHFHYRLIELIFWARMESIRSRTVFPWRTTNVRKYDDDLCREYKYLTRDWNQHHAANIFIIYSAPNTIRQAKKNSFILKGKSLISRVSSLLYVYYNYITIMLQFFIYTLK